MDESLFSSTLKEVFVPMLFSALLITIDSPATSITAWSRLHCQSYVRAALAILYRQSL